MTTTYTDVAVDDKELIARVRSFRERKARFVITTCVDLGDGLEFIYTFDEDMKVTNLRLRAGYDTQIPSISGEYPCATLIEMEMVDLFGAKIKGISGGLLLGEDSPKTPMLKPKKEG